MLMNDLFSMEQKVYDDAEQYSRDLRDGAVFELEKYNTLVKEYGRLLRQLRRVTKMSDRTTNTLSTSNVDLLGKVNFDALTGIYNRRYMEENLLRIIKSLARSGSHLCVMMIDIDFFKKYNDTYGHSEGDTCLKTVAETISGCLSRPDDFAARYGGEEFSVILPGTDQNGAHYMAGNILEKVRARGIPHEKNEAAGCVTVSIGVTSGAAREGWSGGDFLKRADEALYQSKENGRNRYTYLDIQYGEES